MSSAGYRGFSQLVFAHHRTEPLRHRCETPASLLIWVFTSGDDPAWYPGDAMVDIVGIDDYPSNLHDAENSKWAALQAQFAGKKPLAILEFGGVPDIPLMQRLGEYWLYAVSWSDKLGPEKNDPADLVRIYTSPGVAALPVAANAPANGSTQSARAR